MSGLHPENTEEETQVTTVEQSRTVTVPEAVVTQILPPATGRTNEQFFCEIAFVILKKMCSDWPRMVSNVPLSPMERSF